MILEKPVKSSPKRKENLYLIIKLKPIILGTITEKL